MTDHEITDREIQDVVEARKVLAAEQGRHEAGRDEIARLMALAREIEDEIRASLAPHEERLAAALAIQGRSLSGWERGDDEWRDTVRDSVRRYRVGRRRFSYSSSAWLRKMVVEGDGSRKWTLDVDPLHDCASGGRHIFTDLDAAPIEEAMSAADALLVEWGWLLALPSGPSATQLEPPIDTADLRETIRP
jgi:hypothetical protein